jgi:hypothetical protein
MNLEDLFSVQLQKAMAAEPLWRNLLLDIDNRKAHRHLWLSGERPVFCCRLFPRANMIF